MHYSIPKFYQNFEVIWKISVCPSNPNRPQSNKMQQSEVKWRKCDKSDYIIERGLIWETNCYPGCDTRVGCHRWTVHQGAGGLVWNQEGDPIFWTLPFWGFLSRNEKGDVGVRLNYQRTASKCTFWVFPQFAPLFLWYVQLRFSVPQLVTM